jgi:hypothetical protein
LLEESALLREIVDGGRSGVGVAGEAEIAVARVIGEDEEDVGLFGGLFFLGGGRAAGHQRQGDRRKRKESHEQHLRCGTICRRADRYGTPQRRQHTAGASYFLAS